MYTALSVGRMTAAYVLSILFTMIYGRAAAYHRRVEKILMPLLDVLQSPTVCVVDRQKRELLALI